MTGWYTAPPETHTGMLSFQLLPDGSGGGARGPTCHHLVGVDGGHGDIALLQGGGRDHDLTLGTDGPGHGAGGLHTDRNT